MSEEKVGQEFSPVLAPALKIINQLQEESIIKGYSIGGSVALMFYAQPMKTDDVDIFCVLPHTSLLISLAPIYKRLEQWGYMPDGLYVDIEGIRIQFTAPGDPLTEEALENAAPVDCEGEPTCVFQYEYALAVKAQANRSKDWIHIAAAMESNEPDKDKLYRILQKYNLLEKWRRKIEDE